MDEYTRVVLHLPAAVAPVQVAVLPLSRKLEESSEALYRDLKRSLRADYDVTGNIGKRYRRQDEVGTPFCVTLDFQTVGDPTKDVPADGCVTVRERDSMEQVRMKIEELPAYIGSRIKF